MFGSHKPNARNASTSRPGEDPRLLDCSGIVLRRHGRDVETENFL